jgi:DNA-binding beta-propeller fold protein YncE
VAVGTTCHAVVSVSTPSGTLVAGPCPRPLNNCVELTITGGAATSGFTVTASLVGLPPSATATLAIPVAITSSAGASSGTRTVTCSPADATGTAACQATIAERNVLPQLGGIVTLSVAGGQFPDLRIAKTHPGSFQQGQAGAQYTIVVTNVGGAPTTAPVTVTDTLPGGLTATALAGSGWTCMLSPLTCTRADALAAGASYPALTLTVSVAFNAPLSVTNTATVAGGGEQNPVNNTATDPTTITPLSAGTRLYLGTVGTVITTFPLSATGDPTPPGVNSTTGGSLPGFLTMATNPVGNRLYVANRGSNTLTVFPLTAAGDVAGPGTIVTLPVGATGPTSLAVNPAATRLYVVNNTSNNVTVFPLNAAGDVVGPGISTPTGGGCSFGSTINAAGTRLYVAGGSPAPGCVIPGTGSVTVFALTASGDIAGPGASVAMPAGTSGAEFLTLNPANTRLYVSQTASNTVAVFPLAPTGDVAGPGASAPTGGATARGVTVNPAGTRLYAANETSGNLTVFPLAASGDLAGPGLLVPLPAPATGPFDLRTNPAGTRLYVTNGQSTITVFTLSATGDVAGPGTIVALPPGAGIPNSLFVRP